MSPAGLASYMETAISDVSIIKGLLSKAKFVPTDNVMINVECYHAIRRCIDEIDDCLNKSSQSLAETAREQYFDEEKSGCSAGENVPNSPDIKLEDGADFSSPKCRDGGKWYTCKICHKEKLLEGTYY